jgi:hypothetical protein
MSRPLTKDEYGMLAWFAEQWPEDLSPILRSVSPEAEAEVFVVDAGGYTTVRVAFAQPPSTLPSASPYEGEAVWDVEGMTGEAMLFLDDQGLMLEVIWQNGWPGRFPRRDELRPA